MQLWYPTFESYRTRERERLQLFEVRSSSFAISSGRRTEVIYGATRDNSRGATPAEESLSPSSCDMATERNVSSGPDTLPGHSSPIPREAFPSVSEYFSPAWTTPRASDERFEAFTDNLDKIFETPSRKPTKNKDEFSPESYSSITSFTSPRCVCAKCAYFQESESNKQMTPRCLQRPKSRSISPAIKKLVRIMKLPSLLSTLAPIDRSDGKVAGEDPLGIYGLPGSPEKHFYASFCESPKKPDDATRRHSVDSNTLKLMLARKTDSSSVYSILASDYANFSLPISRSQRYATPIVDTPSETNDEPGLSCCELKESPRRFVQIAENGASSSSSPERSSHEVSTVHFLLMASNRNRRKTKRISLRRRLHTESIDSAFDETIVESDHERLHNENRAMPLIRIEDWDSQSESESTMNE